MIITGPPTSSEIELISQRLDLRFHEFIGAKFFFEQVQNGSAEWQLIRLYDSDVPDRLLSIAIVKPKETCFWLTVESPFTEAICSIIFNFKPRRIVTTQFGGDLLHSRASPRPSVVRKDDQWIMICAHDFPEQHARFATTIDIARLEEYQQLYNVERSVDDKANWDELITQKKIIVYEFDDQIISVVRLGIGTNQLVSIGGTYTFPAYRRQGFAENLLKYAVNYIVAMGRKAHLIVDSDNEAAIQLYQRIGFERVGTDCVVYWAYL